ncbi:methyltransferase domain-containing protein [Nonomuraea phyllanthi]|uniref:Methyltransferase domain-containing protein n=1 Tax=Nonomuraea phyllanthi TaxID=2219224 RepID=A0A5C4WX49_9ACTN|nr:class I SAM-dependent methyltransferase [Nonomuraea phyllanthi]KAB8197208.1 methyltransferase domain-containing protein [Nonomuraea phyllanthi]QFY06794.1 methyltransferase domain-containing protein [Nonomuraea phyllanthi]
MTEPDFLRDTRASYNAIAADYAEAFHGELAAMPLDRAMFAAFAELVHGRGPVADVGSGPGQITALLHDLGLDAFGVDLSPAMVALARRTYPELRFEEGSMLALDLPDGALGGLVANYSIIHIPQELLPEVFAEFHRVMAPGAYTLIAFQVGDEAKHRTDGFGHEIKLDFRRLRPERIAGLLEKAGFVMHARLLREAREESAAEMTPQAMLLARKPLA